MTLNINYHIRILVVKALNKYKKKEAAKALGICQRSLETYKNIYGIGYDGEKWG